MLKIFFECLGLTVESYTSTLDLIIFMGSIIILVGVIMSPAIIATFRKNEIGSLKARVEILESSLKAKDSDLKKSDDENEELTILNKDRIRLKNMSDEELKYKIEKYVEKIKS